MKKIAIVALKGGVGKSTIVAGLGLALVVRGFKVGFLDIDITGSNLFTALGLPKSPKWDLDRVREKVIVPEVNGYWLLSISSHTGEKYAVLWESSHYRELTQVRDRLKDRITTSDLEELRHQIDYILASTKWRFVSEMLSEDKVTWPQSLDFLIADLPPSTSNEMFSFFDQVKDLFGVIIVSQPAQLSAVGLVRTIDLLRQRQIPIIGLVANQDGFLNRYGELEYQFLTPRVDLREVAKKAKIPFLISIPQTSDREKLASYFSQLADRVTVAEPVVLKEITAVKKLRRQIVKGIARRF